MPRLDEVVMELLLFAHAVTGYAIPGQPPQVAPVPQSYLVRAACDRPCDIYGWYPYGRIIYLDSRLDPLGDPRARAILLHELVHYLQHAAHAFEGDDPCRDWQNREYEAYRVQARWLTEHKVADAAISGGSRAPWTMGCTAASDSESSKDAGSDAAETRDRNDATR